MCEYLNKKYGINGCLRCHTGFICHDNGYILTDCPTMGSYWDITLWTIPSITAPSDSTVQSMSEIIAMTIIKQLTVILNILDDVNFIHGDPCVQSLAFDKEPCSYKYENVLISGPLTLKIVNFSKSSITASYNVNKKIRLYPKSSDASVFQSGFIPKINVIISSTAACDYIRDNGHNDNNGVCITDEFNIYTIDDNNVNSLLNIRNSGIPLFGASLDLYCFMVGLMCEPTFYQAVHNNDNLYLLWCIMWLPGDLITIEERLGSVIHDNKNKMSFREILTLLYGLRLRCNAHKVLWKWSSKY